MKPNVFGARLTAIRLAHGETRQQLCSSVGLHVSALYRAETCGPMLADHWIDKIAAHYAIDLVDRYDLRNECLACQDFLCVDVSNLPTKTRRMVIDHCRAMGALVAGPGGNRRKT